LLFSFILFGCGPKYSYPAHTVPRAIEEIAWKEYKIKVDARVVGTTVGALVVVDALTDDKGQVPKEIHEIMGKAVQVVTRVALSTDLTIDFCMVILRDRQTANELIITRSLDDTKRAHADMIGVEESINRTLFGQARAPVASEAQDEFVLKEVKKESFLAEQIVQRIRFGFSKNVKEDLNQMFVLVDGTFEEKDGRRDFRFSLIALKSDDPRQIMLDAFRMVNTVLRGYDFKEFNTVEIHDYLNRQKLVVESHIFLEYQEKKITEDEILDRYLVESQSIQEAFKLFGFSMPQESGETEAPVTAAKPA
jgi:hypothetical protein